MYILLCTQYCSRSATQLRHGLQHNLTQYFTTQSQCQYIYDTIITLHWLEERKGHGYFSKHQGHTKFEIKGNKGDVPISIKRIEAWEAEIILSIWTGLSGHNETELSYRMEEDAVLA